MSLLLKQTVQKMVAITDEEFEHILSFFVHRPVAKKEFVLKAGNMCTALNFCEKGCFRNFYLNEAGEEVVIDFAWEDYWVGDIYSLANRVPSKYNLQALEDSVLLGISLSDFQKLSGEFPKMQEGFMFRAQRNNNQAVDMLTLEKYASAEERYQKMMERFPGITNRVASIHIASYLGITPESFSRLKRKFGGR
jgi:CRP-like cAMP-binding protein